MSEEKDPSMLRMLLTCVLLIVFIGGMVVMGSPKPSIQTYGGVQEPIIYTNLTFYEDPNAIHAIYFYGEGCSQCTKIKPFLASMEQKYSNLSIDRYEIYQSQENLQTFSKVCSAQGIPVNKRGVPLIIIGDVFLSGSTEIQEKFEAEIIKAGV